MPEVITLENGRLPLTPQMREAMGLGENDALLVEVQNGRLLARPLAAAEQARRRLMEHLSLPVGALAHLAENPDEPATIESELPGCEDIYADID